jgi:hypothetical protein
MPKPAPIVQDELPLESVLSHTIFPGRSALTLGEVAKALGCHTDHLLNLIDCGRITALDISTGREVTAGTSRQHRRCLRIPVSAYDAFVKSSRE